MNYLSDVELLEARERELNAFEEDGDAWHYEEIDAIDEILNGQADFDYEAMNYDYYGFGE